MELLYVSDVLQTESSWQIVLKKSGEGSDADKIKYPNEKVIFTSSHFRAQNILGSLSLQTHNRWIRRRIQGTFIYISHLILWGPGEAVRSPFLDDRTEDHGLRKLQTRSPKPQEVLTLLLSQCPYSKKKKKKTESQCDQKSRGFFCSLILLVFLKKCARDP